MRRRTQAGLVEQTLKELGGYATLNDLYQRIDASDWGTHRLLYYCRLPGQESRICREKAWSNLQPEGFPEVYL